MSVFSNVIKPQGLEPLQFPTKFRSHSPRGLGSTTESPTGDRFEPRTVPTVTQPDGTADVSPDGRWIAYVSDEEGQREVYVRTFPNVDGGKWQISRDGGASPVWGPDSREMFYLTNDGPGTPTTVMIAANDTDPALRSRKGYRRGAQSS